MLSMFSNIRGRSSDTYQLRVARDGQGCVSEELGSYREQYDLVIRRLASNRHGSPVVGVEKSWHRLRTNCATTVRRSEIDAGRNDNVIRHNLETLCGVTHVPCDTYLRTLTQHW